MKDYASAFKGIYPALLTPFDSEYRINEKALRQLVKMNLDKGVQGFYVCGSNAAAVMSWSLIITFVCFSFRDIDLVAIPVIVVIRVRIRLAGLCFLFLSEKEEFKQHDDDQDDQAD